MPLDDGDTHALFRAATCLAADPVPGFEVVLELLQSLIGCTSASFNDMTLATGDFRYVIVPPTDEALAHELKPVYDRFAHQHPLIARAHVQPSTGALRFCDVADGATFTETELFQQFYEPFGLRYQLVIKLPAPPDVVVGYALNRTEIEGEFADRDVAMLDALQGHLSLHHRRVMDLERSRAVLVEAGREGWAVATVRSNGIVEASSRSLSPSLVEGAQVPAEVAALLPTYTDGERPVNRHDITLGADRWRCVVHPVPFGPTVVLMRRIGDEGAATPLLDVGLTPRQADVAVALATTGGTNAQLARTLGMSEGTVKKHLEAVFRVLGVDSRAAAAIALGSLID